MFCFEFLWRRVENETSVFNFQLCSVDGVWNAQSEHNYSIALLLDNTHSLIIQCNEYQEPMCAPGQRCSKEGVDEGRNPLPIRAPNLGLFLKLQPYRLEKSDLQC